MLWTGFVVFKQSESGMAWYSYICSEQRNVNGGNGWRRQGCLDHKPFHIYIRNNTNDYIILPYEEKNKSLCAYMYRNAWRNESIEEQIKTRIKIGNSQRTTKSHTITISYFSEFYYNALLILPLNIVIL